MKGEDLKKWRKTNGWTQAELMEELEITSRQTITSWEKAPRIPRLVELAITAIDQIEPCRRLGGIKCQFTLEQIANRRHDLWKENSIPD
jgi:DNA-binding XRE family transcriptional regulator